MPASVLKVGLTTPVGLHSASTAAAIRAGIVRIREHAFDPVNEPPVPLAWLDDGALPPLKADLAPLDDRMGRLVRLASRALAESLQGAPGPVELLLALPDGHDPKSSRDDQAFVAALAQQAGVTQGLRASQVLRCGRAGGLLALERALEMIDGGHAETLCVGGVDSHFDIDVLTRLAAADRLHGEDRRDGFVPGEAAAFLLLGRARRTGTRVVASAHAHATPLREGTALAVQALLSTNKAAPIQHTYAGATGESLWAREWGIARLRCSEHFAETARLDHPAECIGDTGAACGPLLVGLASIAVTRGYRPAPCLVWCGSDSGERAAALLEYSPERTS